MLRKAGDARVARAAQVADGAARELHPAERALIKRLLAFPAEVAEAADAARAAPHRRLRARARAGLHGLLPRLPRRRRRARGDVEAFRVALSVAAQRTIARALDLLGVDAPDSM